VQSVQIGLWEDCLRGQIRVTVLPGASILDDPVIRDMLDPEARALIWNRPLSKSDLGMIQRIENFAIQEAGRRPDIIYKLVRLDRYERGARLRLARAKNALVQGQFNKR
jgi:hypothetical protein